MTILNEMYEIILLVPMSKSNNQKIFRLNFIIKIFTNASERVTSHLLLLVLVAFIVLPS